MAIGRRPRFLATWIDLCRATENALRLWWLLSEWLIREKARWMLQCLLWPQKSHAVISAISFGLQRSALLSMGGEYAGAWLLGGSDHWGHTRGMTAFWPLKAHLSLICKTGYTHSSQGHQISSQYRGRLFVGALGDILTDFGNARTLWRTFLCWKELLHLGNMFFEALSYKISGQNK